MDPAQITPSELLTILVVVIVIVVITANYIHY